MKKLLIFIGLLLPAVTAFAQKNSFLTFRTQDGTERSISADGLKITFPEGKMKAEGKTETFEISLTDLSVMFFADQPTAIEQVAENTGTVRIVNGQVWVDGGHDACVEVYTVDGRKMERQYLTPGIYIVRWNGRTFKVAAP